MNIGYFSYPHPQNEPVLNYAPGSKEREVLKKTLAELKSQSIDVPMYIGAEEVRSGNKKPLRPPHEISHTLGHYHEGDASHVKQAIDAAMHARKSWTKMNWETRANIFLKA